MNCRYIAVTSPLRYRHIAVTLPPHCRYVTFTWSLQVKPAEEGAEGHAADSDTELIGLIEPEDSPERRFVKVTVVQR